MKSVKKNTRAKTAGVEQRKVKNKTAHPHSIPPLRGNAMCAVTIHSHGVSADRGGMYRHDRILVPIIALFDKRVVCNMS